MTTEVVTAIDEALAHINEILTPLNEAEIHRDPLGTVYEFDWEAIARTGFTTTNMVTVARLVLMTARHSLLGDVKPSTVIQSIEVTGPQLARLINASFPAEADTVARRAA